MVFAFVRSLIGNFGRALMDFYIENGFVINGILLFYALLVFIAHRNYLIVMGKVILELYNTNESLKNKKFLKITKSQYGKIHWEEFKKATWFPLISEPKRWVFSLYTPTYLKKEFTLEKINQFLAKAKKE